MITETELLADPTVHGVEAHPDEWYCNRQGIVRPAGSREDAIERLRSHAAVCDDEDDYL